jgi:hypothetical protein
MTDDLAEVFRREAGPVTATLIRVLRAVDRNVLLPSIVVDCCEALVEVDGDAFHRSFEDRLARMV